MFVYICIYYRPFLFRESKRIWDMTEVHTEFRKNAQG